MEEKSEMFLLLRALFLVLIVGCLFGCGTDEDSSSELPVVTIELLRQEGEEVWFRLNVVPASTTDLAVLLTAKNMVAPNEHRYKWIRVPSFRNSEEFGFLFDTSVSWEVKILPLDGIDLDLYSPEDSEIPADFTFSGYRVGIPSEQTTQVLVQTAQVSGQATSTQMLATVLSVEMLRPMPRNSTLIVHFDTEPENVTVSHGKVRTSGKMAYISSGAVPFPLGEFVLKISWAGGRRSKLVNLTISEPDVAHPQILQTFAIANGVPIEFKGGGERLPPDTEAIEMQFNELVREYLYGKIDIQSEMGDKLGWEVKPQENSFGAKLITLHRSDGKRLLPETTYTIKGAVIDVGGNITWPKITFTTAVN